MAGQQAGTNVTGIRGGAVTLAEAADAFLSSPRAASLNTRRAYAGVLDRLAAELGPGRPLAAVPGDEIAGALRRHRVYLMTAVLLTPREGPAGGGSCAARRPLP